MLDKKNLEYRLACSMKQHRRFLLNQLTGFAMLIGAALFVSRPVTAAIDSGSLYFYSIIFIVCGYVLVYLQYVRLMLFFLLTLPIFGLSTVYFAYVFTHDTGSFVPGYGLFFLFVVLQYSHARQEEWYKWTNP